MTNSASIRPARPGHNLVHLTARVGLTHYRAIDELTFPTRRVRTDSEKQLCKIEASIREWGFIVPVLVNGRGEVISGIARVEAARRAGLSEVPTICIDHLSDQQVRAFRIRSRSRIGLEGRECSFSRNRCS